MGLDVYFRRDIASVLRTVACAIGAAARKVKRGTEYIEGVRDTLIAVGYAFGLEPLNAIGKEVGQGSLETMVWAEIAHRI